MKVPRFVFCARQTHLHIQACFGTDVDFSKSCLETPLLTPDGTLVKGYKGVKHDLLFGLPCHEHRESCAYDLCMVKRHLFGY